MEEAEEEVETEVDDDDGHGVDVIPVNKRERGRALRCLHAWNRFVIPVSCDTCLCNTYTYIDIHARIQIRIVTVFLHLRRGRKRVEKKRVSVPFVVSA